MIAAVKQPHERLRAGILGPDGRPFASAPARKQLDDLGGRAVHVRGTYDAARESDHTKNYWANADNYSADSANSKEVRAKLVSRARYETANNPYVAGIVETHANYLIGTGPLLRMQTGNEGFNQAIEAVFTKWAAEIRLQAKLWTMAHAKTQDGESFGIVATNPKLRTRVKLDIILVETDQVTTPQLAANDTNYIDGIKFDDFHNPLYYDVLPQHPGGQWGGYQQPNKINAQYMLHWFRARRPGQHRGIPELAASLNCGAASRRWREAILVAAESAADFAVLLQTTMSPDEADLVQPFSTAQISKGMMAALPWQYDAKQLDAKHPNSTFVEFHKAQISEQARPLNMPYNVAACDSSSYNYASGRLDHQTYFSSLDVEREQAQFQVLDKLFDLFWAEAVEEYAFNSPAGSIPAHTWDWPQHPVADVRAKAIADNFALRNGSITIPQLFADQGYDAEEQAQAAADYFGIPIEQYKLRQLDTLLPVTTPPAGPDAASQAESQDQLDQLQEAAQ